MDPDPDDVSSESNQMNGILSILLLCRLWRSWLTLRYWLLLISWCFEHIIQCNEFSLKQSVKWNDLVTSSLADLFFTDRPAKKSSLSRFNSVFFSHWMQQQTDCHNHIHLHHMIQNMMCFLVWMFFSMSFIPFSHSQVFPFRSLSSFWWQEELTHLFIVSGV